MQGDEEGQEGGWDEQEGGDEALDVEASEGLEAAGADGEGDSRRASGPEAEVQEEEGGAEGEGELEGEEEGSPRGSGDGEEVGEEADVN
jgi:hypothetical protein